MLPAMIAFAAVAQAVAPSPAAADPGAARIEAFYPVLLDTMKHGKALGFEGRVKKLRPGVEQLFAFPAMAQFAVGPRWAAMSPADRQSVVAALSRYTVRSYAHNFDDFSGEQLHVDPQVATRGPDKLVKTSIAAKGAAPVSLSYRMRQYGGEWKAIDVFYNSVSQLTAQRSEFAALLAAGGAPALVRKLDGQMLR